MAASALATSAVPALAQGTYPERPIKFIVPWPAGGSSDVAARVIARYLQDRLKQPLIVDNRAGASGNIGAEAAAKAPADGYTLLLSSAPMSINPSLYRSLPFDVLRDFTAVAQIASIPSVLVVHPSIKAHTIQEFVKLAHASKEPLAIATPGNGSAQHLALELLIKRAKLDITSVPYKGGAPALTDVLGGQVAAMMSGFPEVAPSIKAGKLRALAVTTATRSTFLPQVPTLMEAGLADAASAGWNGIHVPSGTPDAIVKRLSQEINQVLAMPDVRQRLADLGFEVRSTSQAEFTTFVTQQMARWKEAVQLSGAQAN